MLRPVMMLTAFMTVGFVAARAHRQIHGAGEASGLSFSTM
jgi:hypothetical protein